MNELVKIYYMDNFPYCSGKELHRFLEIGTEYHLWFRRMCEYGFVERKDFWVLLKTEENSKGVGRPDFDHKLSLGMAKEIAMIQRTERGSQARKYFIEMEEKYRALAKPKNTLMMLKDIIDVQLQAEFRMDKHEATLELHETRLDTQLERIDSQDQKVTLIENTQTTLLKNQKVLETNQKILEAKSITSTVDYFTIKGYCNLKGIILTDGKAISAGSKATKLSLHSKYPKDFVEDKHYGRIGAYHKDILKQVFGV